MAPLQFIAVAHPDRKSTILRKRPGSTSRQISAGRSL